MPIPHRIHALTNTFSGIAGEARAAAELTRCGVLVAKPYWNDDEVDLLVLTRHPESMGLIPMPIQVKSLQFLPGLAGKDKSYRYIQGLKKRYLAKSNLLSLMIYRPDTDQLWFIAGVDKIIDVYENSGDTKRDFAALENDDDLSIRVDQSNKDFDEKYLVPRTGRAEWLPNQFQELCSAATAQSEITSLVSSWLDSSGA